MVCKSDEVQLDEKVSDAINVLRDAGFDLCIYKLCEYEDGHIRGLKFIDVRNDPLKISAGMINGILKNLVHKEEFDAAMLGALMLSCIGISAGVKFSEVEVNSIINIIAGAELRTEEERGETVL